MQYNVILYDKIWCNVILYDVVGVVMSYYVMMKCDFLYAVVLCDDVVLCNLT